MKDSDELVYLANQVPRFKASKESKVRKHQTVQTSTIQIMKDGVKSRIQFLLISSINFVSSSFSFIKWFGTTTTTTKRTSDFKPDDHEDIIEKINAITSGENIEAEVML